MAETLLLSVIAGLITAFLLQCAKIGKQHFNALRTSVLRRVLSRREPTGLSTASSPRPVLMFADRNRDHGSIAICSRMIRHSRGQRFKKQPEL